MAKKKNGQKELGSRNRTLSKRKVYQKRLTRKGGLGLVVIGFAADKSDYVEDSSDDQDDIEPHQA